MGPTGSPTRRHVGSSPSISLEKGHYHLKEPKRQERHSLSRDETKRDVTQRIEHHLSKNSNMMILVMVLIVASVSSFGTAYYLLVTRWDVPSDIQHPFADSPDKAVLVDFHQPKYTSRIPRPDEMYLAYLPHSGFNNQRIAFENALVLAQMLNRTLLVPPIRLGKPLHYYDFDNLRLAWECSTSKKSRECVQLYERFPWEEAPVQDGEFTLVSWNWLIDLTSIRQVQPLVHRWNMSDIWLQDYLGISNSDIMHLKDRALYQYRFVDTPTHLSLEHKFEEAIRIQDMALYKHRLLHLGSLFGSSRLRLRKKIHRALRHRIRKTLINFNPLLNKVASDISSRLGVNHYYAIHLRTSDGPFETNLIDNVRSIRRQLDRTFEQAADEVGKLDSSNFGPNTLSRSRPGRYPLITAEQLSRRPRCNKNGPSMQLKPPIYLATDANASMTDVLVSDLEMSFPCVLTIHDFESSLSNLQNLRNAEDGLDLKEFLIPFIEALVLARAKFMVGTDGSTFSQFIQDVLWPSYHGEEIRQRG